MKQFLLLLLVFLPKFANAYDIAVENSDGQTIFYNYINNGTELEVTYETTDCNSYSGSVKIPEEVIYMNSTRKVTSIGNDAFLRCNSLTSITIPNNVTKIGYWAFSECSSLTSVTIPDNVIRIGECAFNGCQSLTSITIGKSVLRIVDGAFGGCNKLTSVHISDLESWCNIIFHTSDSNPLYYAQHLYLNGVEIKDLIIPDNVTSIKRMSFINCSNLTSVTISNSVTSIGDYAFCGCEGLTSITIPNSVTIIGQRAFSGCSGITSFTIPNGLTSIENNTFSYCTNLSSVTIPNNVKSIGDYAFQSCYSLNSVIIPNSVASIGTCSFIWCNSLTSIIIPNSVTKIGERAFGSCQKLTSIIVEQENSHYDSRDNCNAIIETSSNTLIMGCKNTVIPNNVINIEKWAFADAIVFGSITIPNSVTNIGDNCFWGCSLYEVTSLNHTPPTIYSNTFTSYPTFTTLKVPIGSKTAYQNAEYWKNFTNIVEIDPSGVQSITLDKDINVPIYDMNGRKLKEPSKGINIISGKKYLVK